MSDFPEPAPLTEADPSAGEDIWVTARHAADVLGRSKRWIDEQCRAGRLPCHRRKGARKESLLVPMAATRNLAAADRS